MKKFNFAKIVSLVFVCAMLLCALAVTALAEDETTVEIVSNNVFFGEKYQLMYAVNAPANAKVSATVNGEAVGVHAFADEQDNTTATVNGKECTMYILDEGVAAQAIDTVVTFTVEADGKTATSNYSVLQYVYERLNVKNVAQGDEKTMLESFLTFADAANKVIDEEIVSFKDYKYVTVEGGTLDGNNTAGMFLPGATPFANIEATIEVGASQSVGWTVSIDGEDANEISLADLKGYVVEGNTVVTATAVNNVCDHIWTGATCTDPATCTKCGAMGEKAEHSWKDADCTNPKTCEVCGATDGNAAGHKDQNADYICDVCEIEFKATLSFDSTDNRVSLSNDEQVWSANGVTFVNRKSSSTTNIADYSNPIRLYKGSQVVVEHSSIVKIVFNCNSSSYATELKNSIGDDATVSDSAVTIVLAEQTDSYTINALGAQVRINSIDVYYTVLPRCEHTNTVSIPAVEADCTNTGLTEGVKCEDCGTVVTPQTEVAAKGHTEVVVPGKAATCAEDGLTEGKACSVCHEILLAQETISATGEHVNENEDEDNVCDVCGADMTSDKTKAEQVLAGITGPADVTEAGDVTLDITNETGYDATITWSITGGTNTGSTVSGNNLTVLLSDSETTLQLTVTVTVGEASASEVYTINVAKAKAAYVDKTYSYTFTAKQYTANGSLTLGDVVWTLAGDGNYWGYDATKGQQLGSGSNPYKNLTLTSAEFTNVKTIKINTSGASSVNATFTVFVNGVQVGSSTKLTTSATSYTFTLENAVTGTVEIRYTQTSSKAIYIKSLEVTYQEEAN